MMQLRWSVAALVGIGLLIMIFVIRAFWYPDWPWEVLLTGFCVGFVGGMVGGALADGPVE